MNYLQNVENAAAPGPLVQDNFEELEAINTFERQPSKVNGVATTLYGPPAGTGVLGRLWTDVGRNQWLCTLGGGSPKWHRISAWPAPNAVSVVSSNATLNWDLGELFTVTAVGNVAFQAMQNVRDGMQIMILITGATGGAISFVDSITWDGNNDPTFSYITTMVYLRRINGAIFGEYDYIYEP